MAKKKTRRDPAIVSAASRQPASDDSPVVSDDDGIDIDYEGGPDDTDNEVMDFGVDGGVEILPSDDDNDGDNTTKIQGNTVSNGVLDIDMGEESDSSSDGDENPVGDIPMRWYDGYDHIGYDRSGEKLIAKNKPTALDLAADPHAWRKFYDEKNDRMIELSPKELKAIARMRSGRYPSGRTPNLTEHEQDELVKWSGDVEQHPLPSGTEPKRRFLPSRHEARLMVRLVRAMREGKLKSSIDDDNKDDNDDDNRQTYQYDIWAEHEPKTREEMTKSERARDIMRVQAPKPELPSHAESYNPPSEYLPSQKEIKRWNRISESSKGTKFLPMKFSCLRHVPRYDGFVRERFERCLDLYLAVRIARDHTQTDQDDPDSLVPDLPRPKDLRPFPTDGIATFKTLPIRARTMDIHSSGQWLVVGCDDGCVRVLDATCGYVRATWNLAKWFKLAIRKLVKPSTENNDNEHEEKKSVEKENGNEEKENEEKQVKLETPPINAVAWCPRGNAYVFSAVVGKILVVVEAARALGMDAEASDDVLRKAAVNNVNGDASGAGDGNAEKERRARENMRDAGIEWNEQNLKNNMEANDENEKEEGYEMGTIVAMNLKKAETKQSAMIVIQHPRLLRTVSWHRKGDYIACVGREGNNGTVYVHRLSRRATQIPFKWGATIQTVKFHPTRPFFLVATMHHVRIYNLSAQQMVKTLKPGVSWISSMDVHSSGDHVLITSYDRRTVWFDLDLSIRPYKTLRNHRKAARIAKYHPRLPLFADAADDGECHIFHGMVYDDLNQNALIVPVRRLKSCSKIVDSLGVLDICWHPKLALLYTCGADGTIKLYADCSQGL